MKQKKKIVVVCPHFVSGGSIVLSTLCKYLVQYGYDAKIFYIFQIPGKGVIWKRYWLKWFYQAISYYISKLYYMCFKNTQCAKNKKIDKYIYSPVKGLKRKYSPIISRKNTIVVYPELIYGNPLKAENVVRWLLSFYKYSNDSQAYGKNDLFVCYREIFNDYKLNPQVHKLSLNYFDAEMYHQYNFKERRGKCYIIRKGKNRSDLPQQFDGPIIDYDTPEKKVVEIFNQCKYCYSYDTQTFYTAIAAVCGCIPIVVMEEGKSINDYLSSDEQRPPGIAFSDSDEELKFAIDSREQLLDSLDYDECNKVAVKSFIDLLEKM